MSFVTGKCTGSSGRNPRNEPELFRQMMQHIRLMPVILVLILQIHPGSQHLTVHSPRKTAWSGSGFSLDSGSGLLCLDPVQNESHSLQQMKYNIYRRQTHSHFFPPCPQC